MPYRYEIFLSYPRLPMVVGWLNAFFEPLFNPYVREELLALQDNLPGGQLRVFRDQREIGVGERWPRTLREAARDSRCAVAILLPSYFASEYCRAELETFRRRGRKFNRNLVAPIRFHDCLKMPLEEQVFDLSRFTAMVKESERWVEFHDQIKLLAEQVARLVVEAPPYPNDPNDPDDPDGSNGPNGAPWLAADIPEPPGPTPITLGRICL
ncbi:MAG TPA: toll/interleukin-1 receptor domain-containing protein [Myxococcaceae bacterium]|jgi:hypothetical protein